MRLSEVVRGEVGTSERRVRGLFQEAKQTAPSIVFIDEFQAIFTSRGESNGADGGKGEVGSTLSAALAGCFDDLASWNRSAGPESIVTVIAATNEPWAVDGSFLRPGRLGKCLLVGPLDTGGRAAYVRRYLGAGLVAQGGIAESVAQRTEGFSGADLSLLCARARRACAEGSAGGASLSLRDFEQALQFTAASTSAEDMEEYQHWQAQYPHLCGAPDTS
jgi:SpoVK/Ycf46/Vps4 family AAA+-type ATPase